MNTAVDQFSQVTKSQAEAQLQAFSELAQKALHSVAELAELNIATAKASLEESSVMVQEMLSAKDPQAAAALLQSQAQPAVEKVASYGRHLAAIASKAQADLTSVTQDRIQETTARVNAMVDKLTESAPVGSENFINMFKVNVANVNAAYAQFVKFSQNSFGKYQEQLHEMSSHFTPVVAKPAKTKKAAAA